MNPPDFTDLFRLVYRSRGAIGGQTEEGRQQVDRILAVSRHKNAQAGVTGALLFTGSYFVQALEGQAAAVEATFDRICCDLRHSNIEVVECGPVLELAFGAWSMSHLVPTTDAGALLARVEHDTELADAAVAAMKLMIALIQSEPHAGEAARRPTV